MEEVTTAEPATTTKVVVEEATTAEPTTTTEVVIEEATATEPTMATEVVIEEEAKMAEDQDTLAIESIVENLNNQTRDLVLWSPRAAGQVGAKSSDHRAKKEVMEDVPLGPQRGVVFYMNNEEEDIEDSFDLFPDFIGPSTVGSSSFRSRDRVPHPKDIPNRGHIFDDECLQRIW